MRGHLRERSKGTWAIILDLGRDAAGKRRQKWHSFKGTKRQAENELARLVTEMEGGTYIEPVKLTVAAYLRRWLEDQVKPTKSARSYERYEEVIRLHLAPALGHLPLAKLTPLDIQGYYTKALQTGRRNGHKGGLSARTVAQQHVILKSALKQAVRWRLILRNPADAVDPPRAKDREMMCLDEEQSAQVLEAARGTRLYMPLMLALTTGMRRNEILGLRWRDIDLEGGKLAVRQSLSETRGGIVYKAPKTAKGRRVIDLLSLTVEALVRHKGEQAQSRLLLGDAYEDNDLVVPRPDGRPNTPCVVGRMYHDLAKKLGLPTSRFHDLRHTHATLLLRQGEHPKVVAERLGHSSVNITLDRYSHVLPDMQEAAARRLDSTLRKALGV